MSDKNTLNLTVLTEYLESNVVGFEGPITAEKFPGGQSNPTFKIEAKSGVYVLRRQPPGNLLKSAHAVDREYEVLSALKNTNVPVAKVHHLCEDTSVIGSMFYIMEFCEGRIFWKAALSEITDNETRTAMYDSMNQTLVNLHSVDIDAVGLSDYGKPGNYFKRQLERWVKQYKASELQPIEAMNTLISWLENNLPEDDGKVSLVHGDYRLDNLMFDPRTSEVIAVLDWELSTIGHPYSDLAYQCMQLRMPQNMGSIDGLKGIDRKSLGIPTEEEYVAKYCERMGLEGIEHWSFYLAFSFFRLGAIVQGVAKRAVDGNASNSEAGKLGAFVKPLALMALDVLENDTKD